MRRCARFRERRSQLDCAPGGDPRCYEGVEAGCVRVVDRVGAPGAGPGIRVEGPTPLSNHQ